MEADDANYGYNNIELTTRTSWADARVAYEHIQKGRATGNLRALWIRWKLQAYLYRAGCFIQRHCGKVLFVGLLVLSLCCVGLKTANMEKDIENLWVDAGGRLTRELAYTTAALGEGSGTTSELVIQTPRAPGGNLLTVDSLLLHYNALLAATKVTVEMFDITWNLRDICYAVSFPSFDDDHMIDNLLNHFEPCVIITPLDCFWEGSKLLGPERGVYIPYYGLDIKWTNLDPIDIVNSVQKSGLAFAQHGEILEEFFKRAGITTAYQEKPCLNPYDPECPSSAPNYHTKQAPDVAATLNGGCDGFATKLMRWKEDMIIGGVHRSKNGQLARAESLQSIIQLLGESELYDFYRETYKIRGLDWNIGKAKQLIEAWQRSFTVAVRKVSATMSSNVTGTTPGRTLADNIYPFSWASLIDIMQDFSQISLIRVAVGYTLMLIYVCLSLVRLGNPVQSQASIGLAGVILIVFSMAAGLGICSVIGIKFNASTTQIVPFLAMGLGVDDVFFIAHTFAQLARRTDIAYMDQTGECLKRVGVTVLLTSISTSSAFFVAAIIPIPAMRAFSLQCAILVLFNLGTILVVFPAVVSFDLLRRRNKRIDFFCCVTGSNLTSTRLVYTVEDSHRHISRSSSVSSSSSRHSSSCATRLAVPVPCAVGIAPSQHLVVARSGEDGSSTSTSLIMTNDEKQSVNAAQFGSWPVATGLRGQSCTSSHSFCSCSDTRQRVSCTESCAHAWYSVRRWSLTRFARNWYAPLLEKTATKVLVTCLFGVLLVAGCIGVSRVKDGLDITDLVPRGTVEHGFFEQHAKYFGFYNMHTVTQKNFDYASASGQVLMHSYNHAFLQVDHIIKEKDGSLPDSWLQLFRSWLIDVQSSLDKDIREGCIGREGWHPNASSDGRLGYKLIVQTGDVNNPVEKQRWMSGRLVDKNGIIYPPAFYTYLSAWASNDVMAFDASHANIRPPPQHWLHDDNDRSLQIPRSGMITYAQLEFYLHGLRDTETIISVIKEIRAICGSFSSQGLPNYPQGIVFTFWEQYINLRFYLAIALVSVLVAVFIVLSIVLFNPWAAIIVIFVVAMMVIELFGLMGLVGIKLSAIPAAVLVITVGIGLEFTIHPCVAFLTSIGSRNHRMRIAVESVFSPVAHGAVSTLLSVVMLVGAEFDFIVRYFFVVLTMLIFIGMLNGMLLLPVLLSFIGPNSEVIPLENGDHLPLPSPKLTERRRDRHGGDRHGRRHRDSSRSSSSSGHRRHSHRSRPPPPPLEPVILSTIPEESSQSSSHHSITLEIVPEVVVVSSSSSVPSHNQSARPRAGGEGLGPTLDSRRTVPDYERESRDQMKDYNIQCVCRASKERPTAPVFTSTTPAVSSSTSHTVTTIKATARVKVELHTPIQSEVRRASSPEYKSKKRKRNEVVQYKPAPVIGRGDFESSDSSDCS